MPEDIIFWGAMAAGLLVVALNVGGGKPFDWLDSPRQAISKEYGYEDISTNYQPLINQFVKNVEGGNFIVDPRYTKKMESLNAAGDASSANSRKNAAINNSTQNYRWGSKNMGGTAVRPFIYGNTMK